MAPPSLDRVSRGALLRCAAAGASLLAAPPGASGLVKGFSPPTLPDATVLPLLRCGGAFCTEYRVDGQRFRAVADTGSPFLLVDGSCGEGRGYERWGCFAEDDESESIDLADDSVEGFGGQDVGVQWRRGALRLSGVAPKDLVNAPRLLRDRRAGARAGSWTTPSRSTDLTYEPINFGVVRSYVGRGGGGAIYLGLAKSRQARIRPSFLEQTDIQALRFDFVGRTLTLARRPLLPASADAIPLVDLRPRGAPVAPYACAVHRLLVNGEPVDLRRPCVAILDTGTTGLVLSDSLYDSEELPLPGAAMRDVVVEVRTERGQVRSFRAARAAPADGEEAPRVEAFPLIVTRVRLPWFEAERGAPAADDEPAPVVSGRAAAEAVVRQRQRDEARAAALAAGGGVTPPSAGAMDKGGRFGDGLGDGAQSPHVIFLGLAFLSGAELTIDADDMRMGVEQDEGWRLAQ